VSVVVALADLPAKLGEYTWCYVLTNGESRPHLLSVMPVLQGEVLRVDVGRSTAANAAAHGGAVTLCFPPAALEGFTLIVDGTLQGDTVTPTHAILHRPAPS
jgi:predicted RNA-binding protein with TRAM domain